MKQVLDQHYVSAILANQISQMLSSKGYPVEDRIVLITPTGEVKTDSGIILSQEVVKEMPKKGTIIQIGHITEPNYSYRGLEIGDLVTFGVYAGKEIELNIDLEDFDNTRYTISVLSLNEIIYIEKQ